MTGDRFDFDELMSEAHRVKVALDCVTQRDGAKVMVMPVSKGKRVYSQLLVYQRTARMTPQEAHSLQDALEQLQARLKFFGESV